MRLSHRELPARLPYMKSLAMANRMYCIKPGYRHRETISYYDDTALKDEWQKEVYQKVLDLMQKNNFSCVYDVGCGSGYKLVKYLGQYETVGFDVPETVRFLRNTYPDRIWEVPNFKEPGQLRASMVVCSDVIEHVADPDEMMGFLTRLSDNYIVLSTPDRDLVYPATSPYLDGPPRNVTHLREWSFNEFFEYISTYLLIEEHFISNEAQATQVIVGRVAR